MKNKILLIVIIFIIIFGISLYFVYNYRTSFIESQKINNIYKSYENIQILGTELASIINQTEDTNAKLSTEKNQEGSYIENDTASIKMYIKLQYEDDYNTYEIERILKNGIDNFIKVYGTASFKCTEINYHKKTGNVKDITFTEVDE